MDPAATQAKEKKDFCSNPIPWSDSAMELRSGTKSPLWVLFFILAALLLPKTGAVTHPTDIEALRRIKSAIDPVTIHPASCLGSWDFSVDPCDAKPSTFFICGIRCDFSSPRRVIELALDGYGYRGPVSPFISTMSALQFFDISGNAFHGPLPASISRLSSLVKIEASGNNLSGQIPAEIGNLPRLLYLSLSRNRFTGFLPRSIGSLKLLQRLYIFSNELGGDLPALDGLKSLQYFDASNNHFGGSMPDRLPPNMIQLLLRNNRIGGELPVLALTRLYNLEVLDLRGNQIYGHIPSALFQMPSLQQLNLANNLFSSLEINVHEEQEANSQLIALDMGFNQLRGELPIFPARMKRLSALVLRHNFFTGMIPLEYALKAAASITGVSQQPLLRLYLDGNFLEGELPAPFLGLLPGQLAASFVNNCLQRCPVSFFCAGGQRPESECRAFSP